MDAPEQTRLLATSTNHNSSGPRCKLVNKTRVSDRKQISSFMLFASSVIILNLCTFEPDLATYSIGQHVDQPAKSLGSSEQLDSCLTLIKRIFSNPLNIPQSRPARHRRVFQADAKVLAKVAKMWYIKKKIKKLNKKLKKHTIAVPVITAIPIYEHSYYPSPHVTHIGPHAMHHAAASYYAPAYAPVSTSSGVGSSAASTSSSQLATSSSNTHQQIAAFRVAPHHAHHTYPHHPPPPPGLYHAHGQHPASHQIINSYPPAPPMYVDDTAGIYGQYGNAYGRYDGGYHIW